MKLPTLCLLLLVCLAGGVFGLKCFSCPDCGHKIGNPQTCGENENVCLKVEAGPSVIRKCETNSVCGLGKAERAVSKAWTKLKNLFKDVPDDTVLTYCCDTSYCNPGNRNIPALGGTFAVLVHLIFAVVQFKFYSL